MLEAYNAQVAERAALGDVPQHRDADLEGLEVYDAENNHYGAVTAVYDFGAGDLLELKGPGKRPVLIPFSEAAVLEIDLEGGRLLVDPIAAGLKDDGEEKPYGNAGGKPRPNNGR